MENCLGWLYKYNSIRNNMSVRIKGIFFVKDGSTWRRLLYLKSDKYFRFLTLVRSSIKGGYFCLTGYSSRHSEISVFRLKNPCNWRNSAWRFHQSFLEAFKITGTWKRSITMKDLEYSVSILKRWKKNVFTIAIKHISMLLTLVNT